MSVKCPKCQTSNPSKSEFCKNCGAKLVPLEKAPIHTMTIQSPKEETIKDVNVGDVIDDKYKLMEKLGSGGMGVVYKAEQKEPIRRNVALKIIKLGMDTKEVVARFELEKQALAVMTHPNIAKVHDAGATQNGRPYFVMELVSGIPITDFCDKHMLTTRERLEVFIPVCDAVQHAHLKSVIHRDLKPSNVLVEFQGDKPIPKIIDFGIAKATEHRLAYKTLLTERGQLIGTPDYMSPEQAEMSELDVDTRTDIYSLGVMLYELLAGVLPFDPKTLRSAGFGGMQRIIREEEPPRASTRLSGPGDTQTSIAKQRRTDAASLHKQLKGDLDWITMKAMEKDRTRRYSTASDLIADITRHLKREPIIARPPSRIYNAGRFIKRHKWGVAMATMLILAVVIGGAAATIGFVRATKSERLAKQEEQRASQEAETARQVSNFLIGLFNVSDPSEARGNTITAREILDKGAGDIEKTLTDQPLVQARLMATIGKVYTGLGLYQTAKSLLEKAVQTQQSIVGDSNPDTRASSHTLADVYFWLGQYKDAENLYAKLIEVYRKDQGEEDPKTLKAMFDLASVYYRQRRDDECERLNLKTLEIQRRVLGEEHPDTLLTMDNLAVLYTRQHRLEKAEPIHAEVLEISRRVMGEDHPDTMLSAHNLAVIYAETERYYEAEALFVKTIEISRRVLGADHQQTQLSMNYLAGMYQKQRRFEEAEQLRREVLAIRRKMQGNDHLSVASSLVSLGTLLSEKGNFREAESLLRESIMIQKKSLPAGDRRIAYGESILGGCLTSSQRYSEAEQLVVESYEIIKLKYGEKSKTTLEALERIINLYDAWGKPEKAAEYRALLKENEINK